VRQKKVGEIQCQGVPGYGIMTIGKGDTVDKRFMRSRRSVLKTGLASLAAAVPGYEALAKPKTPGETRVLYLGGDYVHNGMAQELHLRQTFSRTGWRLMFVQATHFLTPAVLREADLLMMTRIGTSDTLGFTPDGIVADRPDPDLFMLPETENAIVGNVIDRGMGFIAFHATVRNPHLTRLMALLGCRPHQGSVVQTIRFHDFNPDHPITSGYSRFDLPEDENQATDIVDDRITLLFKSLGLYDNIINNAGWCVERGKGRVVALLAGHSSSAWLHPLYRTLQLRAAYWAMKRDVPDFGIR